MIPARRMERRAGEARAPGDVWKGRSTQAAAARDDDRRPQRRAALGRDLPRVAGRVEARRDHAGAEAEVPTEPEAIGAAPQVVEDLALRRELAGPVGVGRERERVEVRRHVAGGPGVVVVAPGAADVAGLLEDDEVVDPRLLESDRHAEPREARAEDQDAGVEGGALHGSPQSDGLLNQSQQAIRSPHGGQERGCERPRARRRAGARRRRSPARSGPRQTARPRPRPSRPARAAGPRRRASGRRA